MTSDINNNEEILSEEEMVKYLSEIFLEMIMTEKQISRWSKIQTLYTDGAQILLLCNRRRGQVKAPP